jgi:cytochrome oxidase assembly protein ShyY1
VLHLLRQPRWIGFAVLVLFLATTFVLLGRWQLHRLAERRAANRLVSVNLAQPPVPATALLSVGHDLPVSDTWRRVQVTGHYDPADQILVRNHLGNTGFDVLTPLVTDQGPVILVDRGLIPPSQQSAGASPEVVAPPTGPVRVVVRLRPSEAPSERTAPAGQTYSIDVPALAQSVPYAVYGGYGELEAQSPAPAPGSPEPPARPSLSIGPHLIYAGQWFSFALIAVIGFFVLGWREATVERLEASAVDVPA